MGAVAAAKHTYASIRDRLTAFLANDDPLAAAANTGAFLVWGNQPFYPLYVWLLVGREAWPSLLTWLSTPVFFAVAPLGRQHPLASRVLFVAAGVLNTLLSIKAFSTDTSVHWFLVPCLVIVATFFRVGEWKVAAGSCLAVTVAALLVPHLGPPLHAYAPLQAASLSRLNLWSVMVLTAYLLFVAGRVRWQAHRNV